MNTIDIVSKGLQQFVAIGHLKEIEHGMIDAWAMLLNDIPEQVLGSAFIEVAKTFRPRFYQDKPYPETIRSAAMNMFAGEWAEAFEECVQASFRLDNPIMTTCPQTGALVSSGSFQFSSPLIRQVFKDFGGVDAFKGVKEDDRTIRAQFRDVYNKTYQKAQGQHGTIKALAQHKSNVTQISSAKSSPDKYLMAPDHELQTEKDERIKARAEKIRAVLEKVSPEERQILMCEMLGIKQLDFAYVDDNDFEFFGRKEHGA